MSYALRSSNFALKWANAQIVTSTSAVKLETLAKQVDKQASIIQQRDKAYEELKALYQQELNQGIENHQLGEAIQAIKESPLVEDTELIQQEISQIESDLSEITGDE